MEEIKELKMGLMHAAYKMRRLNIGNVLGNILQSEYFTLETIYHFQKANQQMAGIYVSDLAKRMNMASSATSRLLHSLEKKQWISREVDRNDRRNTYVCLTEEGLKVRKEASVKLNVFFERVTERMGVEDLRRLIELWDHMADVMAQELDQMADMPDIFGEERTNL